ncbi:hypothetical protein QFZ43_005094 [Streptomyces afghaniensis]|nr:hypothetical protein [Streptomyces afghaniensis]
MTARWPPVAAVANGRHEALMMWRHRFIADSWAWELPMDLVQEGETPRKRRPAKRPAGA